MRKNLLLVILVIMMVPFASIAQQKPFKLGLQIAPGLGWMRPDAATGYESDGARFGFTWGFISDFALTDNYFVSTGFNLLSNTGQIDFKDIKTIQGVPQSGSTLRKYNLKYIEIPVTIKMKTNQFGAMKYYGQIGFGPAFNISAKAADEFAYTTGNLNEDVDISDEVGLLQASLIFGVGTEYYIDKSTAISASLMFRNGFTNLLDGSNAVDPTIKEKATPFTVQLCIGVIF